MIPTAETLSTAKKIEHTLLGLGAAISGGWLAPVLIEPLIDAQIFSDPDLVIALVILFVAFTLLMLVFAHTMRSLLGWPIAQVVAIPLGAWRSASYLARHSTTWQRDPEGGACLAGALALLRRETHDSSAASTISAEIADTKAIGTAGISAAGFVAASRGDLSNARELLQGALLIEGKKAIPRAQTIAREWLIADAAARGAWQQVASIGSEPWPMISLRARFLVAIAGRFTGAHSATDTGLWLLWLLCPGHQQTRPLFDRARVIPQALHPRRYSAGDGEQAAPNVDELPELPEAKLTRAIVLHAHWSARDPLHLRLVPDRLVSLLQAWDAAYRSGDLQEHCDTRASILGILTKAAVLRERFLADVAGDLAELTICAAVPLTEHISEPGELSRRVSLVVRNRMLDEVEDLSERLGQRSDSKSELPAVDEWREWAHLVQRYELAGRLGGLDLRRLMFPEVHRIACSFAVWLWNERREYGISTPIFRWLLAEAQAVGDESAIELQRRNLGAGK